MVRPTQEQVDEALRWTALGPDYQEYGQCMQNAEILAAEVDALRGEMKTIDLMRPGHAFNIGGLWFGATNAVQLLNEDNERLRAEHQDMFDRLVGAESELRELREEMEGWKEEAGDAEELRADNELLREAAEAMAAEYESRNGDREKCWVVADELRAVLAKAKGGACDCHDEDVSSRAFGFGNTAPMPERSAFTDDCRAIRHYCEKHWSERGGE